jgi:hypothetical protein
LALVTKQVRIFSPGSFNIYIGSVAGTSESNTIRIGNTQNRTIITGISGTVSSNGSQVYVNSSGQLGSIVSSARFKRDIQNMADSSNVLLSLRPVKFRYKNEIDPEAVAQFGLVAEEVEKVSPDLVVRDKDGKPYSVRYDQVNAMLLNEFLKEHRKNEEQQATITCLQKQLAALTEGLQKVSAQLELSKAAPQIVRNEE